MPHPYLYLHTFPDSFITTTNRVKRPVPTFISTVHSMENNNPASRLSDSRNASTVTTILVILLCLAGSINNAGAQIPTVASLVATGTGIQWYSSPTGGTALATSTLLVNGQVYYASQTINGCESTARLAVTASLTTVSAPATGTHTPSQTQVEWNWNTVSGATGYKWSTANVYSGATDQGNVLTKTETGLTCNTAYTRYAWAYNASGCVSAVTTLTQTTSSCVAAPSITTLAVTNIGATTATFNGNITAINGANANTRGFKYSTSNGFDAATTGTNISETGSYGTGSFSLTPSGLTSTTTYYIRAYATNSAGTTYSDQVSFTTIVYTLWTFTNASATGLAGPTQTQVNAAYTGTSLAGGVVINTQGIQEWAVPVTGSYRISASGAQGARSGGLGADMTGTFSLTQGEIIKIVVGQVGADGSSTGTLGGGGGGYSLVIKTPYTNVASILVAAGGGGGYTNAGVTTTMNAFSSESGGSTYSSGGGTSGNGGNSGITNGAAAGGGGFLTDGTSGAEGDIYAGGGKSFLNGAAGGNEGHSSGYNGGDGGFGGGGGGWHNSLNRSGGGGGYSGGQGGTWSGQQSGGGGGSYNAGTNQTNTAASRSGNGQVVITKL